MSRKEYNEIVSQHLEMLARNRRNRPKLNTVVGEQIIP